MKHIHKRPHGYMVIVHRRKIRFAAWIPGHTEASLIRAQAQRDHFLKVAGPMGHPKRKRPHRTGHSNTGIPGITEHTTWSGGRAYPCFSVRWAGNGIRRFHYRDLTTRETALAKAKQLRQQKIQESERAAAAAIVPPQTITNPPTTVLPLLGEMAGVRAVVPQN